MVHVVQRGNIITLPWDPQPLSTFSPPSYRNHPMWDAHVGHTNSMIHFPQVCTQWVHCLYDSLSCVHNGSIYRTNWPTVRPVWTTCWGQHTSHRLLRQSAPLTLHLLATFSCQAILSSTIDSPPTHLSQHGSAHLISYTEGSRLTVLFRASINKTLRASLAGIWVLNFPL